jgi:hypothetical protein
VAAASDFTRRAGLLFGGSFGATRLAGTWSLIASGRIARIGISPSPRSSGNGMQALAAVPTA